MPATQLRISPHHQVYPMKTLLASLAILIPCDTPKTFHAASHLVAAQVVREFPMPLPDDEPDDEPAEGEAA